jgi:serine/threonine protein kinase
MELKPGAKLGPYEIVAAIGKGGMGEVWKARDPRLGRDVAIKVSAQQFTDRFEREARAIAALNHPNICTLHDVGPNYLVMEFIEGPTLADRIAQGPIPLDEALAIARQVADALEAAHEKGIVHRDLKPANIKVKPDGAVKVLDFGLAKSAEQVELTENSPTMLSMAGTILGTAAYMAPEQARGRPTDKRADIFAFAVVLHEMVTGRRLFGGEDAGEMLAKVIRDEPDISDAPPRIHRLLVECLRKDPRKRLRDIGDVWRLLDDVFPVVAALPATAAPQRTRWWWPAAAAVLLLSTAALAFVHFREAPPALAQMRFEIAPPAKTTIESFSLSPDGRKLVFNARNQDGHRSLWLRAMDSLQVRELPGTQGAVLDPAL